MIFADPTSLWAAGILNSDAFPLPLRRDAATVAHCLAAFRLACETVIRDVPKAPQLISRIIEMMGPHDFAPTPEKPIVFLYETMSFTGSVYGMLITTKSLFDVCAPLVTRSLVATEVVKMFSKEAVNGVPKVPGGKLLNWLDTHARRGGDIGERSKSLHALFRGAIDAWLGVAIKWRDDVAHYGGLKGLEMMAVPVKRTNRSVREDEVVGPFMPDGTPVALYADQLLNRTLDLIGQTVRLLPSVDAARLLAPTLDARFPLPQSG